MTFPIQRIGGGQCYVASKARCLEKNGWRVIVISPGSPNSPRQCWIDSLNQYKPYLIHEVGYPLFCLPSFWINKVINKMIRMVGDVSEEDKIIIESHNDVTSFWGELLASRIKAQHFFFALNESYRGKNKYYENKMDFFLFKYNRKEILCYYQTANRLFEGYRSFEENDIEGAWLNEEPVQDVKNEQIDHFFDADYTICYIGRANKPYVDNIISSVGEFAKLCPEKRIQFVTVGNFSSLKRALQGIRKENANLIVLELGPLHPLPRSLFKKVDVVIAGSGSARCSVEEGVLTILADPDTQQSAGLLGYDTYESVFQRNNEKYISFKDALIEALIKKDFQHKPFFYKKTYSVEECVEQNFKLMEKAVNPLVYFDENKLCAGRISLWIVFKIVVRKVLSR